jgi:hypothetical protein
VLLDLISPVTVQAVEEPLHNAHKSPAAPVIAVRVILADLAVSGYGSGDVQAAAPAVADHEVLARNVVTGREDGACLGEGMFTT